MISTRNRAEDRMTDMVKDLRGDRPKRVAQSRKEAHQVAKSVAGYFESKAKTRKYFYSK